VGAQRVRIRLPKTDRPGGLSHARAKLLVSGKSVTAHAVGEHVEVMVPAVLDHEVVAVDLA
jgi:hypothetical protein